MMNARIELDGRRVVSRIEGRLGKVQAVLDQQIAKDSNYYAPEDEGYLQRSVLIASKLGSGELLWATPYARAQYYGLPNKSRDRNPNARMKWFEHAKANRSKDWERIANETYNR